MPASLSLTLGLGHVGDRCANLRPTSRGHMSNRQVRGFLADVVRKLVLWRIEAYRASAPILSASSGSIFLPPAICGFDGTRW
jgi:hypothetical protein